MKNIIKKGVTSRTKKIACLISDSQMKKIDFVCRQQGYSKAEFTRKALRLYVSFHY